MLFSSFRAGIVALKRRPRVPFLLYGIGALLGLLVTAPFGAGVNAAFAETGFDMPGDLDVLLLADFIQENGGVLSGLFASFFWGGLIFFLWSAAAGVGVINAVRDGAVRSFWAGVSEWYFKSLGLSALYFLLVIGWSILVGIAGVVLNLIWSGEIGLFWVWFAIVPTIWICGLAILDMSQDYSRIGLVVTGDGVFPSLVEGIKFGWSHKVAGGLYLLWFVPAALLVLLPSALGAALGAGLLVFLLQQLVLVGRSFATVGWLASEVDLHDRLRPVPPALADSDASGSANERPEESGDQPADFDSLV